MSIRRLRQPAYTGENRCVPCTVANVAIALGIAAGIALAWRRLVGSGWPAASGAFLLAAFAAIWLRGYLVPGTPTLTKRYFPEWLLAAFDKEPPVAADESTAEPAARSPETLLSEAGVVEPCADADDLCLDDGFRTAWDDRIAALADADARRAALAHRFGVDADAIELRDREPGVVAVTTDRESETTHGRTLAEWPSRATVIADLAADDALAGHVDGWKGFGERTKSSVLGGLRAFLDACPECGGAVTLGTDTVESCCRTHEVLAVGCEDCGARLLEVPADGAEEGNGGGRPEQAGADDDSSRPERTDDDDDGGRLERAGRDDQPEQAGPEP